MVGRTCVAAASDDLDDTLDYGELVGGVPAGGGDGSPAAARGRRGCHRDRSHCDARVCESVTVRVRKLAVPIDADLDFAQVELRREVERGTA